MKCHYGNFIVAIALSHPTPASELALAPPETGVPKLRYLEQTQSAEKVSLFCSRFLFQNRGMIYGCARVSTEA